MNLFEIVIICLIILSFVGVVRPFGRVKHRGLFAVFAAVGLVLLAVLPVPTKNDAPNLEAAVESTTQPQDAGALLENSLSERDISQACGEGGLIYDDVVGVTGSYPVKLAASDASQGLKNEKASKILGKAHYHVVDNSTTVRRKCVQGDWTQIQIVSPEWMTHVAGWVKSAALRDIVRTTTGARVFVAEDFIWDGTTTPFRDEIVLIVNRISQENRNCGVIDPSSVAQSDARSQAGDPVFYVTCGVGVDAFNVWFRPKDAVDVVPFQATAPLGRDAAVALCEQQARLVATHPSSVKFSRVWDLAFIPHLSGRSRVVSSFTAKNAFDVASKYRIECLFEGEALLERHVVAF